MSEIRKVLVGPSDTDFGIARIVELPDGSGRGEVFDVASKSWVPSTNPKLTVGELMDSKPVSPALAERLGLADDLDSDEYRELFSDRPSVDPYDVDRVWLPDERRWVSIDEYLKHPLVHPNKPDVVWSPGSHKWLKRDLLEFGAKLVKAVVRNLNYNAVNDSFSWTGWRRLPAIVKASTVSDIEQRLNVRAWLIADRWAFQTPQEVRAMEADGSLLRRLSEQEMLETEQGIDPKTGVVPDSRDHSLLHAYLFKPETVKLLLREPLRVQQVADRWASGSPKKVKAMEANGTLLPRLKEQAELENSTLSDAQVGGAMNDTPDSEILALHEIPSLPD